MELIGKLKDEISKAKDKKEAKEIMENAGMKLTDDELDAVAGGAGFLHAAPKYIRDLIEVVTFEDSRRNSSCNNKKDMDIMHLL